VSLSPFAPPGNSQATAATAKSRTGDQNPR
jgi:hypothetical protein